MVYYRMMSTRKLALCPVLVVPLVFLTFELGMLLAALNIKCRDLPSLIQLFSRVLPIHAAFRRRKSFLWRSSGFFR